MSPKVLSLLFALVLAVFLSTAGVLLWHRLGPTRRDSESGPTTLPALTIPAFELIDADGRPFSRESLAGKVWIVHFFFTHCPVVCPMLTEKVSDVASKLNANPEIGFASFSVDPAHDTPARLHEYMNIHDTQKAGGGRWVFLTHPAGDDAPVRRIVTEGLQFALEQDAKNPVRLSDGRTMANIVHPTWLVLLDKQTNVVGLYRSSVPADLDRLEADARRFAARPAPH